MRFTSLSRARRIRSRHDWLLVRNRSSTEWSIRAAGLIFPGARARLVFGEGSAKLRINQFPNYPGVIWSTGE